MRLRQAVAELSLSEDGNRREVEPVSSGARSSPCSVPTSVPLKSLVPTLAIALIVLVLVMGGETEQAVKLLTKLVDTFQPPVGGSLDNKLLLDSKRGVDTESQHVRERAEYGRRGG